MRSDTMQHAESHIREYKMLQRLSDLHFGFAPSYMLVEHMIWSENGM